MKNKKPILIVTVCICILMISIFGSLAVSAPSVDKGKVETEPLHKTEKNTLPIDQIEGQTYEYFELDNLQGYREITIYLHSWDAVDAGMEISIAFHVMGRAGLMSAGVDGFVFEPYVSKTYDIIGNSIVVALYNPTAGLTIDDLTIGYYLTT